MIGKYNLALDIFLAGQRFGKYSSQQILRAHALDGRGHFFTAHEAEQGQRAPGCPAPARGKNRRGQHGLLQQRTYRGGMKKIKNIGQRKTVLVAEGNIQAVVGGGCLQFKIK